VAFDLVNAKTFTELDYVKFVDCHYIEKESSLESYVDDSKIYLAFPIQDIETAAFKLTQDMERITAWCCINSLLVNPKKTKLLLLGTTQMLKKLSGTDFHITVLGEKIQV
jgi:hypothetical protein